MLGDGGCPGAHIVDLVRMLGDCGGPRFIVDLVCMLGDCGSPRSCNIADLARTRLFACNSEETKRFTRTGDDSSVADRVYLVCMLGDCGGPGFIVDLVCMLGDCGGPGSCIVDL